MKKHIRSKHVAKKQDNEWGSFGSFEGYVKCMVPRIGSKGVAKALKVSESAVCECCVKLNISPKKQPGYSTSTLNMPTTSSNAYTPFDMTYNVANRMHS